METAPDKINQTPWIGKSLKKPLTFSAILHFVIKIAITLIFVSATGYSYAQNEDLQALIVQLEDQLHARIGVSILYTDTNQHFEYQGNDLFPLLSTFKPLACAALLHLAESGRDQLARIAGQGTVPGLARSVTTVAAGQYCWRRSAPGGHSP